MDCTEVARVGSRLAVCRAAVLRVLGLASLVTAGVASANPTPPGAESLAPLVASVDTAAAVVVRRASDGAEWTGGGKRVDIRFVPASTFKIPNTLIILGAGIIADPEKDVIPWDGVERGGSWDQDQTLRTAFRRSAYWAYSRLARQAGHEWVESRVSSFGYGNENVGGPEDTGSFWLEGPLEITAREQVGFLSRLRQRTLPVPREHIDLVVELMELHRGPGWILRGKTGWGRVEGSPDIGWFVGWLEGPRDTWLFAVNLDITDPDLHPDQRRELAEHALSAIGAYSP